MGSLNLTSATDGEVMQLVGQRLRALRESQRLTTIDAATRAGLSRRTVYRAEKGDNPTLQTVVRLLRLYGRIDALDSFIPAPELSPMAMLERKRTGQRRGGWRRG